MDLNIMVRNYSLSEFIHHSTDKVNNYFIHGFNYTIEQFQKVDKFVIENHFLADRFNFYCKYQ